MPWSTRRCKTATCASRPTARPRFRPANALQYRRRGAAAAPGARLSLAGKLEDVPLADVMQFIHLGRRTGTLSLRRGNESAEITFHRGAIVGARSATSRKIGE